MLNSVLDCKEKIVKKIEGYQLSNLSNPELFILKSLQSGEALYGIQIRNHIEACFKRRLNFSTLYPKLDLLLAQGLIEVEEREDNSPSFQLSFFSYNFKKLLSVESSFFWLKWFSIENDTTKYLNQCLA